ncbi:MAG: GNAT family N-acetyltransferase [Actinobacteria bacterium]|nr:GNAT family N-acetyltransferase [Actinomycetota bacterium]
MSGFELRAYEPGDRQDYLRLLEEAWVERALPPAEFDWWFDGNPAGSLRSVATIGGRVVGVAGHSLLRMILGGRERLATFSVHATTDAAARGRGIFVALERRHEQEAQERGAAVVLAFASAPTTPLFLGPLGWTEIARYRIWARPLRPRRGGAATVGALSAQEGDAASTWPNHVVRDQQHLRWRFAESPRGYRFVRSGAGYAVLGSKRYGRLRAAVLADVAAPRAELGPLLRAVARASKGSHALIGVPWRGSRPAFLAAGFVPTTQALHFMGKSLAGRLDTDPEAWRFALGDTDFF